MNGNQDWSCFNSCESADQCQFSQNQKRQKVDAKLSGNFEENYFYNLHENLECGQFESTVNVEKPSCRFATPLECNQQSFFPRFNNQTFLNYNTQFIPQPTQNFPLNQTSYYSTSWNRGANFPNHYNPGNFYTQTYAPCQGPQPWNYAYCYGSYDEAPCQFSNVVDMEDFM